jgi:cell division protein FtsB
MNKVLSLQLARERAWQPRGGSSGHAFKRLGLPRNQRLLERLEAENAQLRRRAVELVLQIQALRDGAGTLIT